jgi:hypothetical protein
MQSKCVAQQNQAIKPKTFERKIGETFLASFFQTFFGPNLFLFKMETL